jgi:hypothetical protein
MKKEDNINKTEGSEMTLREAFCHDNEHNCDTCPGTIIINLGEREIRNDCEMKKGKEIS